jgi:hypothetical protein
MADRFAPDDGHVSGCCEVIFYPTDFLHFLLSEKGRVLIFLAKGLQLSKSI